MRFIDEQRVVLGTDDAPDPTRVLMRGFVAEMFGATTGRGGVPVFVTERRFPRVRVRCYLKASSSLWFSRGLLDMSLFEYSRLLMKAWRGSREPIPQAWVR